MEAKKRPLHPPLVRQEPNVASDSRNECDCSDQHADKLADEAMRKRGLCTPRNESCKLCGINTVDCQCRTLTCKHCQDYVLIKRADADKYECECSEQYADELATAQEQDVAQNEIREQHNTPANKHDIIELQKEDGFIHIEQNALKCYVKDTKRELKQSIDKLEDTVGMLQLALMKKNSEIDSLSSKQNESKAETKQRLDKIVDKMSGLLTDQMRFKYDLDKLQEQVHKLSLPWYAGIKVKVPSLDVRGSIAKALRDASYKIKPLPFVALLLILTMASCASSTSYKKTGVIKKNSCYQRR